MAVTAAPSMRVSQLFVSVASERPNRLFRFCRDTLGLAEAQAPGLAVQAGGAAVTFVSTGAMAASGVQRMSLSLVVEDLSLEQARLEAAGVSFARRKGHDPSGARVSTLLDPDGNHVHLIEPHEEMA